MSLRRRPTSKYTPRPPQVLDRRCSLRSSPALWMPWLHAALLAVPHRHAAVRSRRQCRESSLTVDPHPLRTVDTPARDHGIGRPRRGSRLSATKPGGEQQASRRASGRRTSTTLAFGHWDSVFKFENQLQVPQRTENLDPQNFGRKQQDKKRSVSQSDLVVGMSTRDFFLAWYKYF